MKIESQEGWPTRNSGLAGVQTLSETLRRERVARKLCPFALQPAGLVQKHRKDFRESKAGTGQKPGAVTIISNPRTD